MKSYYSTHEYIFKNSRLSIDKKIEVVESNEMNKKGGLKKNYIKFQEAGIEHVKPVSE